MSAASSPSSAPHPADIAVTSPHAILSALAHRAPDSDWLDAGTLSNALNNNHFVDLLALFPEHHNLPRDIGSAYAARQRDLSAEFRRQVNGALARALPAFPTVIPRSEDNWPLSSDAATRAALSSNAPFILNGVLCDNQVRLTARLPPLLRAEIATSLFPAGHAVRNALSHTHGYVFVLPRRRALSTAPDGRLRGAGSHARVMAELLVWRAVLSDATAASSLAMLVGLNKGRGAETAVADGANVPVDSQPPWNETVWRAAIVDLDAETMASAATAACNALRWRAGLVDDIQAKVHSLGDDGVFALARSTTDARERPNMKVAGMYDWPWATAKRALAVRLRDPTLISGVGNAAAAAVLAEGLPADFGDERVTAKILGAEGFAAAALEAARPGFCGADVRPERIVGNVADWRATGSEEADNRSLYVDFELAAPDGLYSVGSSGGTVFDEGCSVRAQEDVDVSPLVFMIGCGRWEKGVWRHRAFVATGVSKTCEAEVVRDWAKYVADSGGEDAIAYVWGPEPQLLGKALTRMCKVDADMGKQVQKLVNGFRMVNMQKVVTGARVVVRGALSNSVKAVAGALRELGKLEGIDDGAGRQDERASGSGIDAMAWALDAAEEVREKGLAGLHEASGVEDVRRYNEDDCRDLAAIVRYLRKNH